ncbi:hypothetical protein FHG87_006578 [Trinorchestia longiramus]|nr:hypothetical protein FHG87_006578 [Trinorchestia longiramus]
MFGPFVKKITTMKRRHLSRAAPPTRLQSIPSSIACALHLLTRLTSLSSWSARLSRTPHFPELLKCSSHMCASLP